MITAWTLVNKRKIAFLIVPIRLAPSLGAGGEMKKKKPVRIFQYVAAVS